LDEIKKWFSPDLPVHILVSNKNFTC